MKFCISNKMHRKYFNESIFQKLFFQSNLFIFFTYSSPFTRENTAYLLFMNIIIVLNEIVILYVEHSMKIGGRVC